MDYDYRTRSGQMPNYRPATSSAPSSHPMYGPPSSSSMYPRVGQQSHTAAPPPYGGNSGRPQPHHQTANPPSSSSSGLGIRVTLKPEYRITPPFGDIPRSNFQFDFDLERKVLAELEKETPNWAKLGLENIPPPRAVEPPPSSGSGTDPVVSKYIASGLSREAVPLAVANYGDNPTKVREFVNAFTLLREMGFPPNAVAEALMMYDNDTDKALAHFLNSSS
ncbi:uncharacterized protein [Pyrus communis]|uniref:uncharacterized protein isoform X2 n=1 Tax=Pyrus communis TaxID=23211 RepID=UPI0035BF06E4